MRAAPIALWICSCVLAASSLSADTGKLAVSDEMLQQALQQAGDNRSQIESALDSVPSEQQLGLRFLVAHMPVRDLESLSAEFILKNVDLAYRARKETKWGSEIPEAIFLNDVLPYASVNEKRDDWREDFFLRFRPMVEDCRTPGEAAQLLNRDIYKLLDVQYHARKRPKPDQSPYESIEAKYASCTGLSILLIDACRAVCVPARFVGTPQWTTKRGNHSWVEIWSEGSWHFTGACEYDPRGLDRGWFTADAAQANKNDPRHAIWASSWQRTPFHFPMIWARRDDSVSAINVTERYAAPEPKEIIPATKVLVGIDVWSEEAGERIACDVILRREGEKVDEGRTRGSGEDSNHRWEVLLEPETQYDVELMIEGTTHSQSLRTTKEKRQQIKLRLAGLASNEGPKVADPISALEEFLGRPRDTRGTLSEQAFRHTPLSRSSAEKAAALLWDDHAAWIRGSRAAEMEARELTLAGKTLRFHYTQFGDRPPGERSLYISLHGGGNTRPEVNERAWKRHRTLYELSEGIYLTPRAPTDTWNMWHQAHIDPLFDRLISNLIVFEGVDPNRVYLLGYSAGGDGVYQLAPRMADRWAAAAMMAGHPNETSPLGLRNIGFALHMGGEDKAYNRNDVAREWKKKLAELERQDPDGYRHQIEIHEGKGHWMELQDAVALPWMANFVRDLRPRKIVWLQDDVTGGRSYWLAVDGEQQRPRTLVQASRRGQVVEIESSDVDEVTVLLDDRMLDLDQPVSIRFNGQERFSGQPSRTIAALARCLAEREDPEAIFSARVTVRAEP